MSDRRKAIENRLDQLALEEISLEDELYTIRDEIEKLEGELEELDEDVSLPGYYEGVLHNGSGEKKK